MATYLVLPTDGSSPKELEGDSIQQALESAGEEQWADGEELVVYRVLSPAKHVRFKTISERRIEIS